MPVRALTAIVLGIQDRSGWAIVDTLREQGYRVAALFDPQTDFAAVSVDQGINIKCDTTIPASVEQALLQACEQLKDVDGLVCLADHRFNRQLTENTMAELDQILEGNMTYAMRAARQVMKKMMQKRNGSIVFVASTDFSHPQPGQVAYATAFGGLESFTRAAAMDGFKHNIRVNCLLVTDRNKHITSLIDAIQYLLGKKSAYITGSSLTVDEIRVTGW